MAAANPPAECREAGGESVIRYASVRRRRWRFTLVLLVGCGVLYLLLATAVFDFSAPAYPYSEEYHAGREVAIGPRPRALFCRPSYHGMFYEGREWPFVVFQPVCRAWLWIHNLAPSAEWRSPTG